MCRHAYWIAAVLFGILVLRNYSPATGFTSLIHFGSTWQTHRTSKLRELPVATLSQSNGYDGQFYAELALDPFLKSPELEPALDVPVYRARRILAPAVAALLGVGDPWMILQSYSLLNVACWFVLGWLLFRQLAGAGWAGFARWAGCMFGMGVLDSVRQSLVDLPALLLLSFGILSHVCSRPTPTALWLVCSNLTKETSLLGSVAVYGDGILDSQRRGRALAGVIIAAAPLGLWSFYVQHRFGGAALGGGLGNLSGPFLGLFIEAKLCLRELLNGNFDGRYSFGLIAIVGLMTQAIALWSTPQFPSAWWRVGAVYALLLPFLGMWVWSGYWAACRAVLPMTVAFNLLLPFNRTFWPLWIVGNLTLVHAIWRFL